MTAARRDLAQMVTRLEHPLKDRLKKKAKAAGRTLNAEVVYRLDVEGRIQADLAAGRIPDVVSVTEPAPAPADAPVAIHAAAEIAAAPGETWVLLKDIHDAVRQEDADCVIPTRLGKRLIALLALYPRLS